MREKPVLRRMGYQGREWVRILLMCGREGDAYPYVRSVYILFPELIQHQGGKGPEK
jgi:hypothetical protein